MIRGLLSITLCAASLYVTRASAAECNERVSSTTPLSRFIIDANGSVRDLQTALIWSRCPIGYSVDTAGTPVIFTDDTCEPSADGRLTWQQALEATPRNWRLPNVKELMSIVERRCASPAMNVTVFPEVDESQTAIYWTSSPVDDVNAYVLDFTIGEALKSNGSRVEGRNFVRLVQ